MPTRPDYSDIWNWIHANAPTYHTPHNSPIRSSPNRAETRCTVRISAILLLRSKFSWPNIPNCFALRICCGPNSIKSDYDDIPAQTSRIIEHFVCQCRRKLNSAEILRHHVRWIRENLQKIYRLRIRVSKNIWRQSRGGRRTLRIHRATNNNNNTTMPAATEN